ncbi:MAG: GGGtGRT protein [Bacilli bacterium]|nr:GGGtGRT protein [Bacilli bacterium]
MNEKDNIGIKIENYDRRKDNINKCLKNNGFNSLKEAFDFCLSKNVNPYKIVSDTQPIAFEDAKFAYVLGCAIALKKRSKTVLDIADNIGDGLQSFCINGSVADIRKIGVGHAKLGAMLLNDKIKCFCFLAGHESFAAAEGAIKIALNANKIRKNPLKVILNGLGKDAAYIISRINGFTYVETKFNFENNKLIILNKKKFSNDYRSDVFCYGANDVTEGVAIMEFENVGISITGNSTNPTRFQHLVAGIYKKKCFEKGIEYFSVASGGGTGRTLHPDNVGAGPASYGMTDTLGKVHCDVQFAGSSSVPAHVEMMGFVGMGNNPLVGATVSCIVECFKINQKK